MYDKFNLKNLIWLYVLSPNSELSLFIGLLSPPVPNHCHNKCCYDAKFCQIFSLSQAWATYGPRAGSGPRSDFDRPADCIQPYPVMSPEASFLTVSDRCALTELSVRDTSGNWRKTLHSIATILNVWR